MSYAKTIGSVLASVAILASASTRAAQDANTKAHPTETAQSCRIDLDRDGRGDLAVLVPYGSEQELVVLLDRTTGYEAHRLFHADPPLILACEIGDSLTETKAARGQGAKYQTGGTYLRASQPEGASFGFFWQGSKFVQVSVAD